jgi:hypothetical protein
MSAYRRGRHHERRQDEGARRSTERRFRSTRESDVQIRPSPRRLIDGSSTTGWALPGGGYASRPSCPAGAGRLPFIHYATETPIAARSPFARCRKGSRPDPRRACSADVGAGPGASRRHVRAARGPGSGLASGNGPSDRLDAPVHSAMALFGAGESCRVAPAGPPAGRPPLARDPRDRTPRSPTSRGPRSGGP